MTVSGDHLAEVLETFPLRVAWAGRFQLSEPWGLAVPEGMALVCAVVEGRPMALAHDPAVECRALPGEALLLSAATEERLCDARETRVATASEWMSLARSGTLDYGGGGRSCVLMGGVVEFDDPKVHPFCWGLPPVVHFGQEAVARSIHVRRIVGAMEEELSADLPGWQSILRRLVEVLLVEAARLHLTQDEDLSKDPIGQLLHPDLGPALALMHRQPEKAWTVAELAEQVTMSRSAFAAAFARTLGQPPVQYLRERRMQLATRLLRNPSLGLKEVALRVGYDSVSAFNSAFKQRWGIAPGRFRSAAAG
jgi:AraC-like DNA-binding protein